MADITNLTALQLTKIGVGLSSVATFVDIQSNFAKISTDSANIKTAITAINTEVGDLKTANTTLSGTVNTLSSNLTTLTNNFNTLSGNAVVKTGVAEQTISGSLVVTGNLTIKGSTTTVDTQNLKVKDNLIVTNSGNTTLVDLSGIAMVTGQIASGNIPAYGIVYDYTTNTVKLGKGYIDSNEDFLFNTNEGQPIATRTGTWTANAIPVWSDNNSFVPSTLVKLVGNNLVVNGTTLTGNTGTVTSITAGEGLDGGTISTTGTIKHYTPTTENSDNTYNASGTGAITNIAVDKFGHITGVNSSADFVTVATAQTISGVKTFRSGIVVEPTANGEKTTYNNGNITHTAADGTSVAFSFPTTLTGGDSTIATEGYVNSALKGVDLSTVAKLAEENIFEEVNTFNKGIKIPVTAVMSGANLEYDGSGVWYRENSGKSIQFLYPTGKNAGQYTLATIADISAAQTELVPATDTTLGGFKTGYAENGKNYAVKLDGNNKAYVSVPWEGTLYTAKTVWEDISAEDTTHWATIEYNGVSYHALSFAEANFDSTILEVYKLGSDSLYYKIIAQSIYDATNSAFYILIDEATEAKTAVKIRKLALAS